MLQRIFSRTFATQASAAASSSASASTSAFAPASVVHLPLTYWPREPAGAAVPAQNNPAYVPLPAHVFDAPARPDILHQCVVAHLASLRQGSAHTKNRAEVKGSNRKIMRQKGSGKARVGDARSPIRRGGGHAFAKRPKDWSLGLNRKVYELGVRTALSERWRRGELSVIPTAPELPSISTRALAEALRAHPFSSAYEDSLFLLSDMHESFTFSARNLPRVDVRYVLDLDVYSLLQGKRVVLDIGAVQILADWLASRGAAETKPADQVELVADQLCSVGLADSDANPDGGVKSEDVVIEQEESPVAEKRQQGDPLAQHDGTVPGRDKDNGDKIREHMDDLAKSGKHTTVADEDRPSARDVL